MAVMTTDITTTLVAHKAGLAGEPGGRYANLSNADLGEADLDDADLRHGCRVPPDADRPAERWFLAIRPGDTPTSSQIVAITVGWIDAWVAERLSVAP